MFFTAYLALDEFHAAVFPLISSRQRIMIVRKERFHLSVVYGSIVRPHLSLSSKIASATMRTICFVAEADTATLGFPTVFSATAIMSSGIFRAIPKPPYW